MDICVFVEVGSNDSEMSKPIDKRKCSDIHRNLLFSMDNRDEMMAWTFIRVLQHTAECDANERNGKTRDVKRTRNSIMNYMGKDAASAIISGDVDQRDEQKAMEALVCHRLQLHSDLVRALPIGGYVKYLTYDKWQQFWGFIGGSAATLGISIKSAKRMREIMRMKKP